MFGELGGKPEEAFKVLEELELNQPKSVQDVRQADEVEISSRVSCQRGNASDRGWTVEGMTSRVSKTSVTCMLSEPLRAGDVYRLGFDTKDFNVGFAYALCRRVRMINEETYESSLDFFAPIDLTMVRDAD